MEMQDVDYELIYEPGKDAADPLDYLLRHPLPETERDTTEKTVKSIISNKHGVSIKSMKKQRLRPHSPKDPENDRAQ